MYKKTLFIFIAVIILIGCIAVGFYYSRNIAPVQNQPAEQNQQQETIIEEKKITDTTSPFTITITYPFIAGEVDFNTRVDAMIAAQINDFKKISLENDAAVKETDPEGYAQYPRMYDLQISYQKSQPDADTASILFAVSSYTGGAHGANFYVPLSYNLKDNKEILVADVFAGQADYLQKISDYCIAELTKQITERVGGVDGTWVADGAGPKAENFANFLLKKDNITFYFEPYQVTGYAAGSFEVVMPR